MNAKHAAGIKAFELAFTGVYKYINRDREKNLPRNVWLIMWRHHQLFFPFRGILLKGWASHKNGDAARFQDKFTVNDSHL